MRILSIFLIACIAFLPSCKAFGLKKFDQMTVDQIKITINYEEQDYQIVQSVLESLDAPDIIKNSYAERHDSELVRLKAWMEAELAKKVEDE